MEFEEDIENIQFRFIDICKSNLNNFVFKKIRLKDKNLLSKCCCISYRWGKCPEWQIDVNGEYMANIQAFYKENFINLFEYLKKNNNDIEYFWIDCICINQNSNEDKNLQISYIPVLFNKVNFVMSAIWLMKDPKEFKNLSNGADILEYINEEQNRCWIISELSSNNNFYTSWIINDEIIVSYNRDSIKSNFSSTLTLIEVLYKNFNKGSFFNQDDIIIIKNEDRKYNLEKEPENIFIDINKRTLSCASKIYKLKRENNINDIIKIGYIFRNTESTNQEDKLYSIMPYFGYVIHKKYVKNNIKDAFLGYIE